MRKPLRDALDRIALLEARIAALEARPPVVNMTWPLMGSLPGNLVNPLVHTPQPQPPSFYPPYCTISISPVSTSGTLSRVSLCQTLTHKSLSGDTTIASIN